MTPFSLITIGICTVIVSFSSSTYPFPSAPTRMVRRETKLYEPWGDRFSEYDFDFADGFLAIQGKQFLESDIIETVSSETADDCITVLGQRNQKAGYFLDKKCHITQSIAGFNKIFYSKPSIPETSFVNYDPVSHIVLGYTSPEGLQPFSKVAISKETYEAYAKPCDIIYYSDWLTPTVDCKVFPNNPGATLLIYAET